MRYYWLSVLSVLSAEPFYLLATHLSPHWNDIHVKHAWKAIPMDWETQGHPPADTMIDLYVALKPHNDNSLIDTLYEVSDPRHPRRARFATPPCTHVLTCYAAAALQIWRTLI